MILSYNVPQNKEDSDDSGKEENLAEIKVVMKDKDKDKDKNEKKGEENHSSGWEENNVSLSNASQISNIEHRNSSVSSSMRDGLSKGEDCIQKDVLLIINEDSPVRKKQKPERYHTPIIEKRSSTEDDKIIDISNEMSFNSQKSKNYILKSSLYQSKDNIKGSGNKENSMNKCLNYYINKPKQKENSNSNNLLTTPEIGNKIGPNFQQNTPTQLFGFNHQPGANAQLFLNNEADGLMNQLNFLSLQPQEQSSYTPTNANSTSNGNVNVNVNPNYPLEFHNQMNKNRLMVFNNQKQLQSQSQQIPIQMPIPMQMQDEPKASIQNSQFFKMPKGRLDFNTDNDLIFNCINYAKEQTGCRQLQKKIEENPSIVNEALFSIVKGQLIDLSCDSFGNYFIQKIIQYLNSDKLEEIIQRQLPSAFRMMSFNPHGTRVIQKIFERAIKDPKLLNYYNLLLKPNMKDFMVDPNANHIIIQYVTLVSSPENDFIVDFICENALEFATQKHSCCALQKCIEYVNQQQKKQLYRAVAENSFQLFTDQYGNYVVQFVVNACDFEINHLIMINFLQDFEKFSVQKYSSNVIEKCLSCCSEETKQLIVEHICNSQIVQHLLFNMYGNYVLQKGMTIAKEPFRTVLFSLVAELLERLQFISFGPKLYNRLVSTFPELTKTVKTDKGIGIGMGMKRGKNTKSKQMNMNMGINMDIQQQQQQQQQGQQQLQQGQQQQQLFVQPQLNSFQNFGNVFYQAHPQYNPYQPMPNPQMNNFNQFQYMQQVLNQGMYIPMQNNNNSNGNSMVNMNYNPNYKQSQFGGGSNNGNNFKNNFYQ